MILPKKMVIDVEVALEHSSTSPPPANRAKLARSERARLSVAGARHASRAIECHLPAALTELKRRKGLSVFFVLVLSSYILLCKSEGIKNIYT